MAGTKLGGKHAAATNKKKYGKDFYAKIGAKGGKNGKTGGFAAGEAGKARAKAYGSIGGSLSKRDHRLIEVKDGYAYYQDLKYGGVVRYKLEGRNG